MHFVEYGRSRMRTPALNSEVGKKNLLYKGLRKVKKKIVHCSHIDRYMTMISY